MTDHEENSQAKTATGAKKKTPEKKRAATKTGSTPAEPAKAQPTPSGDNGSGRIAMSATQRRLEEMGMIDSAEQKSSVTVPSTKGFRIMVVVALVLFVAAVFFIRANSHRSAVEEVTTEEPQAQVAQTGEEPQSDLSDAISESDGDMTEGSAPTEDTIDLAPSDNQAAAILPPPPGMMEEGGGMGYNHPGMQPAPMGQPMLPPASPPAGQNQNPIQQYAEGAFIPNGQPMQPMMGYGYGPSGPYYWFIVPVPQSPGNGGLPAVPGSAGPSVYGNPPAFGPMPETDFPEPEEY